MIRQEITQKPLEQIIVTNVVGVVSITLDRQLNKTVDIDEIDVTDSNFNHQPNETVNLTNVNYEILFKTDGILDHLNKPTSKADGIIHRLNKSSANCVKWDHVTRHWSNDGCQVMPNNGSNYIYSTNK